MSPLIELGLTPRISVEGNAILRSFGRITTTVPEFGIRISTGIGNTWEIPVLAKYRLADGAFRPFLSLGPSFRLPKEIAGAWLSNYGATAGAGVEMRLKRLVVSPAVRYTHWGPDRPRFPGGFATSGEARNQANVLVGLSF